MGLPIWQVRSVDLGTIAENIFFEYPLQAIDTDGNTVTYSLVAGELPNGLQLSTNVIAGIPVISGTPAEVSRSVTSSFTIRATTTTGDVADRTFTLSVTGQKLPRILTPAGNIGSEYYGNYVDIEILASDEDISDILQWEVASGTLPAGLQLVSDNRKAYIRGYPVPITNLPPTSSVGYDESPFDLYNFDFDISTITQTFEFKISVTDGTGFDAKTFNLTLLSRDELSADSTTITADSDVVTADSIVKISPFITNTVTDLGTVLYDNYYAHHVTAIDLENDIIEFKEWLPTGGSSRLPPGLQIHPDTGWIYGDILPLSVSEYDFEFQIVAVKKNYPDIISLPVTFNMKLVGELATGLQWNTPDQLTIENGAISELQINASTVPPTQLYYAISEGSLPPGLYMLPSGHIVGRPSFFGTAFDNNTTVFDNNTTTFDRTFTFTVNAYGSGISAFHTFTITVLPVNTEPYENLYFVAYMPAEDRATFSSVQNAILAPDIELYRQDDPHFGIPDYPRALIANGVKSSTLNEYENALSKNHYKRVFHFGPLRLAVARNADNSARYEVIYSELYDQLEDIPDGFVLQSITPQDVTLHNVTPEVNAGGRVVSHPASINNMRARIFSELGQINPDTLPDWMTSTQDDGTVLGWIPAVPIIYCNPGQGQAIIDRLNQSEFDIRSLNFEIDRYVLDNNMSDQTNPSSYAPPVFDAFDQNDTYLKFPDVNILGT